MIEDEVISILGIIIFFMIFLIVQIYRISL